MGVRQGHESGLREAGDGEIRSPLQIDWGDEEGLDNGLAQVAVDGSGGEVSGSARRIAFVTPRTPIEQAWADLCDGNENADVERVMASIGGWEAWAETPLPYLCFVGAFNGEPEHATRRLEAAHGRPAL
jgi:hypothetical protein